MPEPSPNDEIYEFLKNSIFRKNEDFEILDIETIFNVPGGHWHHSELQIDRMYSLRPVFKYSSYRTPIHGLYICGAGTHPGGGISGKSGINAANQIIKDQKHNNH